ncbi:SPW repeat protein [Pseudonocardia spinosispora]|uniref:SPW repeat protein n=1 Tax=Pseudonocardia spinosispora TaxID=103441 RepID=UPI00055FB086|nr:SPW repeat protein [Pseudonocardia spinosispora]
MKTWTRWQDWTAAVVGAYTALAPIWTTTGAAATATLIVFGVLLLVASLWSLAQPGAASSEYTHAVLGVLLFISPWVLGYSAFVGASWTSWVVGVIAVALGLWAVPESKLYQAAAGH